MAGLSFAVVVDVQATASTAWMSCHGCEIPGRSGFAFQNPKALMGWAQLGRARVTGLQACGSEDKPSVLVPWTAHWV